MFFNLAFCLLIWQDKFGRANIDTNNYELKKLLNLLQFKLIFFSF